MQARTDAKMGRTAARKAEFSGLLTTLPTVPIPPLGGGGGGGQQTPDGPRTGGGEPSVPNAGGGDGEPSFAFRHTAVQAPQTAGVGESFQVTSEFIPRTDNIPDTMTLRVEKRGGSGNRTPVTTVDVPDASEGEPFQLTFNVPPDVTKVRGPGAYHFSFRDGNGNRYNIGPGDIGGDVKVSEGGGGGGSVLGGVPTLAVALAAGGGLLSVLLAVLL